MRDNMELPNHVGIIMDGNGRWAQKRGLKRSLGHKAGADNLEKLLDHIYNLGIKYVSVYAFSTENFKRDKEEVDYLMDLFVKMFTSKKKIFIKNELKVIFSGRRDNLRDDVRNSIIKLEESTKDLTRGVFNICLNYGGRYEIVDMTKKIASLVKEGKIDIESIDEDLVNKYMYQELPPLDFVIRTSGEKRVSNFMLWQASYAEYYFPKTLFPDFTPIEFDKAMREYQKRHRRFGGK
jgi:undecaprenyl diphosphate synthase